MEGDYSNREMDRIIGEVKEQLDRIEAQTMRTNGRVSSLERWKSAIVMTISVFAFVVIPLLVYIYTTQVTAFAQQLSEIKK